MRKWVASMVLCLGVAGLACGPATEVARDCEKETVGKCVDVEYCCKVSLTNSTCWWEANGKKYSCTANASDCSAAAAELAADCQ